MRSAAGASKFEREKWSSELSPILSLWKKLNQSSGLIQHKLTGAARTSRGSAEKDPVSAFVDLEFGSAVSLVQVENNNFAITQLPATRLSYLFVFLIKKLPLYTLAGFDLTAHMSTL
jgi:hypothetical protein